MAGLSGKMDDIIQRHLPKSWRAMNPDDFCHKFVLKPKSNKYKKLQSLMQGDFIKRITRIYQVQNPVLYEQFTVKAAESALFAQVTIKELLHCTAEKNVESIIQNNFDWRKSNRVKYGQGVSFSENPEYAHVQSSLKNGTNRVMIVADVLIGKVKTGNSKVVIPGKSCDTTVSKDKNVYVKYCDSEFYPKYLIYYDGYAVGTDHGQRFLKK